MTSYVVLGAGPVGLETARLLGESGDDVLLVSRSAKPVQLANVRVVRADATDVNELSKISRGANTIFMCAMADYFRWPTDYFPIVDGTVRTAEAVGAKIVMLSPVYGYGENAAMPLRPDVPLDPTTKKGTVRTIMWQRMLRATVPAIDIRASDFLGSGALTYFTILTLPAVMDRKPVAVLDGIDLQHAWSFVGDVARTLVAAGRYTGEWQRAFLVPSQSASPRDLIVKIAAKLGREISDIDTISDADLATMGLAEFAEMRYLYARPLLLDASETEQLLDVKASSLDAIISDMLREPQIGALIEGVKQWLSFVRESASNPVSAAPNLLPA